MSSSISLVAANLAGKDALDQPYESVAETLLSLLKSRGIENFFINAGTDFAPLVEGYARLSETAMIRFPRLVVAGHESVVMGMAHGAYLMTGRPQAVMFHVNVGTANAACGVLNAARENVPIVVCAGRTPIFEGGKLGARNTRVAWGQEMFDQGGLVREVTKWQYELRGALHVEDVVDRALTIAMSEPRGPVYLTFPREVLAERPASVCSTKPKVSVPTNAYPDPDGICRLADALVDAEMPIISALASGADPTSVKLLAQICDEFAIGYVEEQARYLNLASDHPLHLGFRLSPVLDVADAWLFVESDVPWMRDWGMPRSDAFIAHAGSDPAFVTYPMRSHRCDLSIKCGATPLFQALIEALQNRSGRIGLNRRERIAGHASRLRELSARTQAKLLGGDTRITSESLSAVLGEVLSDDCTLFNEYWVAPEMLTRRRPASYFYLPATGGLGWALPAAVGAKLVRPDRTMVAAIGDGTYMFSNPTACHHASQKHGLPVLTIIANNSRWDAVDLTARFVYPDGHMSKREWQDISDLRPSPAYHKVITASGGLGIVVSEPAELADALRSGLHAVQHEGREALINVICQ
jgi:acetolactate synthase I/II/III large subunit